jgi:hypothetical protein
MLRGGAPLGAILLVMFSTCRPPAALPAAGTWPVPEPAFICRSTVATSLPLDSVYRSILRATVASRVLPYRVDPLARRIIIGGPQAPAFTGSVTLRRSRVYMEFVADTADDGSKFYSIAEGSSMTAPDLTHADTLRMFTQASHFSRVLAERAGLRGGGCWSG